VPIQSLRQAFEIVQTREYLNLSVYAQNYENSCIIKAVAFILFSFKFLGGLNFSIQMIFFFRVLQRSYKDFLGFLALFLAILLGLTLFATQYFGPYSLSFNNTLNALFTIFTVLNLGINYV